MHLFDADTHPYAKWVSVSAGSVCVCVCVCVCVGVCVHMCACVLVVLIRAKGSDPLNTTQTNNSMSSL